MCGSGCIDNKRIDCDDGRLFALFQKWKKCPDRQDLAEEFQIQFLAPLRVAGVGECRNPALAGVVDEQIDAAAAPLCDFLREMLSRRPHRARCRVRRARASEPGEPSFCFAAARRAASRPQIATRAPSASRYLAVASPMPELPPVTTAMLFLRPRSTTVLAWLRLDVSIRLPCFMVHGRCRSERCTIPAACEISDAASATAAPIRARRSSPSNCAN